MRSSGPWLGRLPNLRIRRLLAYWLPGPVVAGMVLALAAVIGIEVTGPISWLITGLSLIPAALVHCHNRARNFTWAQTIAVGLAAAAVAYAFIVVGVFAGAAATFAVVIAHQTGALAALASVSSVLSLLWTLRSGRQTSAA